MIPFGQARDTAIAALTALTVPPDQARRTAELLVLADLWGIGSHGLMRLPFYLDRIAAGGIVADAELTVVRDGGATVSLDGNDGLGHWQVWDAAELAATRTADHGIAAVSVASSSHCGALGLYTTPALRRGFVTLVFSTGPAVMAPPGSASSVLSTSPIAAGVPSHPRPAIVDLATSAVARGKIAAHAQRDDPIPPGWAVDAGGAETTDPHAALAGLLAPMGGGKGFALAFLVEALSAGIAGPALAGDVPDMFDASRNTKPQRIGHLVVTLDPAALSPDGRSSQRLDLLASRVSAAGGRIPGAARAMPWDVADDQPVDIAADVWSDLSRRAGGMRPRPDLTEWTSPHWGPAARNRPVAEQDGPGD